MNTLLQDFRYALRQMRKTPGFATTAILTLALAIGVATAAFSVFYAVLLRPLPYDHPERIVYVYPPGSRGGWVPASYPEYIDWRREIQCFSALAGYSERNINFEGPGGPVAMKSVSTTDNFFDVFGVKPIQGRTFAPGEAEPGKNDVAVLSYKVWQQHFGGQADALARTVKLDGRPYTVIGIMPPDFRYPLELRNVVYTPLHMSPEQEKGSGHWLPTVARLKPGSSLKQAQADVDRVMANLVSANREPKGRRIQLRDLATHLTYKSAPTLKLLVWAVLALLAIGCTNVAGLLLARGVKREHEMALRSAVGATRWRLVRQLLTETLLLSVSGALGGTVLACGLINAIRALFMDSFARGMDVRVENAALLVAFVLALLTAVMAGLLPALRLSVIAPGLALKASGGAGSARVQHRMRAAFVVVQVALAFALVITSGLLLRALSGLRNTDLGFDPDHILTTEISLTPALYEGRDPMAAFYTPLLDKVRTIPGVTAAGLIDHIPIQYLGFNGNVQIVGQPPAPPDSDRQANFRRVTPGYFDVFGSSLLRGRLLNDKLDAPGSGTQAIVVNDAFVKKFFPSGEDPIGKVVAHRGMIVGVVRSVRQSVSQPPIAEMYFLPSGQSLAPTEMKLVIRAKVEPESIIPSLRRAFSELDPSLPFRAPETMHDVVEDVLSFERLQNWVFGTFAGLALLLALVGLHALVSHEVELSTRDIGVRVALGATRGSVLFGIYRRVGLMLVPGVAAGVVLTFAVRKLLAAVVVIQPHKDAAFISGLAAGLIVTGALAALIPARRATKVDPMVALRYE